MKKNYEKPDILFENFALSRSIAAGCDKIIDNQGYGECGLQQGRGYIFLQGITGCKSEVGPNEEDFVYNGLCYHVPFEDADLFNS